MNSASHSDQAVPARRPCIGRRSGPPAGAATGPGDPVVRGGLGWASVLGPGVNAGRRHGRGPSWRGLQCRHGTGLGYRHGTGLGCRHGGDSDAWSAACDSSGSARAPSPPQSEATGPSESVRVRGQHRPSPSESKSKTRPNLPRGGVRSAPPARRPENSAAFARKQAEHHGSTMEAGRATEPGRFQWPGPGRVQAPPLGPTGCPPGRARTRVG